MQGIGNWIEKRAQINPNRIACITDDEQLTYAELNERVKKVAAFLKNRHKVEKGDRIGILSQNNLEYVVLLFAIAELQCVAVPLNIRLSAKELSFQLKDSDASILVYEQLFKDMAKSLREEMNFALINIKDLNGNGNHQIDRMLESEAFDEYAPYIICYTSGTTGKPKGAVLTQSNMFWNAINNVLAIDLTSMDRTIVLLPLFHIGGIGLFAFPTLFVGGTIIIPGKFDPNKTVEMIEKHQVTVVMGVPSIHLAILHSSAFQKSKLHSVRWFYSGGAPCPKELIEAFTEKGYLFGQGFGMTETSPTIFMLSREDAEKKKGSIGKPVLFAEVKLVDDTNKEVKKGEVGHLLVRGPLVMKEYWNRPDATRDSIKDGWFNSGDLAKVDEEGFYYIVGRKKEMIISGGENIYPLEIEQVINQIPEILEVAVVGITDSKWGEVPIAFVTKKEGAFIKGKDVKQHCLRHLAKYKVPKEIHFVKELPKNATGKIQKKLLPELREKVVH